MSLPVTQHFSVAEFAQHDGTPYPAEWIADRLHPLCETLEVVRAAAGGLPMAIDSGYRTEEYDQRLYDAHQAALRAAGKPDDHLVAEPTSSQHPKGRAADITHSKLTPLQLFSLVLELYEAGKLPRLGGVGLYRTFVHIDVRPRPGTRGAAVDGHLAIWGGSRPSNVA